MVQVLFTLPTNKAQPQKVQQTLGLMTMFDGSQNGQPWMAHFLSGLLMGSAVLGLLGESASAASVNCDLYCAI